MTFLKWQVGQTVKVECRMWAGINKPGGCGKITEIHYGPDGKTVESLDVKYVVGSSSEKRLDPGIVFPYESLDPRGRQRRSRDFFVVGKENQTDIKTNKENSNTANTKKATRRPTKPKKPTKNTTAAPTTTAARTVNKRKHSTTAAEPKQQNPKQQQQSEKNAKNNLSQSNQQTLTDPASLTQNKKAKNATQVPSLVIATSTIEVSPLDRLHFLEPVDTDSDNEFNSPRSYVQDIGLMNLNSSNSSESVAEPCRRGLFNNTCKKEKTTTKRRSRSNNQKTKQKRSLQPLRPIHMKYDVSKQTKPVVSETLNSNNTLGSALQAPSTPVKVKGKVATSARLQSNKRVTEKKLSAANAIATSAKDPQLEKKLSRQPSQESRSKLTSSKEGPSREANLKACASRTASDQTDPVAAATMDNRKPLKDVYDNEVNKAKKFVQDLVGPRSMGNSSINSPNENDMSRSPTQSKRSERYFEFLAAFRAARAAKFDEDCIDETEFLESANQQTKLISAPFLKEEFDSLMNVLCDEGKVMRSEGMIYMID